MTEDTNPGHKRVPRTSRGDKIDAGKADAKPHCAFCGAFEMNEKCSASCIASRRARVVRKG